MFWFKRKKIVVDAITPEPAVHEYFPIVPARKFIPEYWKALPKSYVKINKDTNLAFPAGTLKVCEGFNRLYAHGFIIPMWSEFILQTQDTGQFTYQFSVNNYTWADQLISEHDRQQMGPAFDHLIHTKLVSPWMLYDKSGIKWHWTTPFWNQLTHLSNMHIPQALVEFNINHSTEINVFWPRATAKYNIKAGTPMTHLMPLTEHEVELKTQLVSHTEWVKRKQASAYMFSFGNLYNHKKNHYKQKSKCPFGFGSK